MSNAPESVEASLEKPERRAHPREYVRSIAYIELDEGNGGIVLNASEGGMAVQTVVSLMDDHLPRMRLQLSSKNCIEAGGHIAWASESRKTVGVRFVNLSEETRHQIREWIASLAPPPSPRQEALPRRPSFILAGEPRSEENAAPAEPVQQAAAVVAAESPVSNAQEPARADLPQENESSILVGDVAPVLQRSESVEEVPTSITQARPDEQGARGAAEPQERGSRWALAAPIGFLALVSLAIGWATGRGFWKMVVERLEQMTSRANAAAQGVISASAKGSAHMLEIEVVDASGRAWQVPFNTPANASAERARRQAPVSQRVQPEKPRPAFRIWTVTPPARQPKAAPASGSEKELPPSLANLPAGTANISPAIASLESSHANPPEPPQPTTPAPSQFEGPQGGQLLYRVEPIYPALAKQYGMSGTVKLHAVIATDGAIKSVKAVNGSPLLVPAAVAAVRQWRYEPTLLHGRPVQTETDITIVFRGRQ